MMMIKAKHFYFALALALGPAALTSCYDDSDLKERVGNVEDRVAAIEQRIEAINSDISTLRQLIASLSEGAVITSVETTAGGYRLVMSDGRVLEVKHGADGADGADGRDGTDAPVVGVAEEGGVYYWTITTGGKTDWLRDSEGNRLPVSGADGEKGEPGEPGQPGQPGGAGSDGADGRTPTIGVKEGYWTVDYGDGPQFILDENGEKVRAVPESGGIGGLFSSVVPGEDEIVFTLVSGESFSVPRVDNFGLAIDTSDPYFRPGQTREYALTLTGVSDIYVSKVSDGWKASVEGTTLTATAPATASTGDRGDIRVIVVNKRHDVRAFRISVEVADVRVLTFEDSDYKGSGNMLGRKDWTSLVDDPQYGGKLLYPNNDDNLYRWHDEGNTELASQLVNAYGDGNLWSGGMAVSNYFSTDEPAGNYDTQLSAFVKGTGGKGGAGGSANFCVQNGYKDTNPSGFAYNNELPRLYFADGKARTVKSMKVCNTLYFVNVWRNGNGLSAPGGDNTFKIVVYAYDEKGEMIPSHPSFTLADGSDIVSEWKTFDLSSLGKVSALTFNLECGVDNGYGMSIPAYFAFDDVEVLF